MNLQTNEWKHLDVDLPEGSYSHECALVYDPVNDVAIALIPSASAAPSEPSSSATTRQQRATSRRAEAAERIYTTFPIWISASFTQRWTVSRSEFCAPTLLAHTA